MKTKILTNIDFSSGFAHAKKDSKLSQDFKLSQLESPGGVNKVFVQMIKKKKSSKPHKILKKLNEVKNKRNISNGNSKNRKFFLTKIGKQNKFGLGLNLGSNKSQSLESQRNNFIYNVILFLFLDNG